MKQSELRQLIRENIKQIYEVEYYRDKAALDTLLWLNRNYGGWASVGGGWQKVGKDGHLGNKLILNKENAGNYELDVSSDVRQNWDRKWWQLIKNKGGKVQATLKQSDLDLIREILRYGDLVGEVRGTWTITATGDGDNKKIEILSPRMLTWDEVGDDITDLALPYDPVLDNPSQLPSDYSKEPIEYDSLYNK